MGYLSNVFLERPDPCKQGGGKKFASSSPNLKRFSTHSPSTEKSLRKGRDFGRKRFCGRMLGVQGEAAGERERDTLYNSYTGAIERLHSGYTSL